MLFAAVALLVFHLGREGAHWQLAPAYAAFALFVIATVTNIFIHPASGVLYLVAGSMLLLLAAAAGLHWMAPMFRLPAPSGRYAVGTRIEHFVDPSRDAEGGHTAGSARELMVQVWYPTVQRRGVREVYRRPAELTRKSMHHAVLRTHSLRAAPIAEEGAPFPLLIFNPAWTGQRTQSTFLMQELASHGYVVASIDHTFYSGLVAFPDGRIFDSRIAPALGDFTYLSIDEGIELADQFVAILAEDTSFVADHLVALSRNPESPWHGAIDVSKIAAFGHSIGGAAAADAAQTSPYIRAALNLDGWSFGETLRRGLTKPWMVIYGKGIEVEPTDATAQPAGVQRYWEMNRRNLAAVAEHMRKTGGSRLAIEGASHWNFADRPLYSPLRSKTAAGTISARRAHRIVSDLALAFFAETFGTGSLRVEEMVSRYGEVSQGRL
ncbi:alpha/beta hydrolase family protein [Silvibacterium sp.]|uniref:alpha/beta hydrolase family protein n=1 Tax=Silvibacterium sp. TaxID=1964179 RepID=UPI0039E63DC8